MDIPYKQLASTIETNKRPKVTLDTHSQLNETRACSVCRIEYKSGGKFYYFLVCSYNDILVKVVFSVLLSHDRRNEMQEQEKEALRTEIYNQIMKDLKEQEKTADLNKQSMNSNVEQANQKVVLKVLGLSKSLWAAIIAPLTVLIIGNGILTHTWPVSIQLPSFVPTSYNNFANSILTILLIIFLCWLILSALSPFRCRCGYRTWLPNQIKAHVEMKHTMK